MSLSIYNTHTHSLGRMSERGEALSVRERETEVVEISYCFRVLLLVLILSLRKLQGFLLYGFPKENSLCLLSLVFIAMHVILSDNILRSYCLNDKNLTTIYNIFKLETRQMYNRFQYLIHQRTSSNNSLQYFVQDLLKLYSILYNRICTLRR